MISPCPEGVRDDVPPTALPLPPKSSTRVRLPLPNHCFTKQPHPVDPSTAHLSCSAKHTFLSPTLLLSLFSSLLPARPSFLPSTTLGAFTSGLFLPSGVLLDTACLSHPPTYLHGDAEFILLFHSVFISQQQW